MIGDGNGHHSLTVDGRRNVIATRMSRRNTLASCLPAAGLPRRVIATVQPSNRLTVQPSNRLTALCCRDSQPCPLPAYRLYGGFLKEKYPYFTAPIWSCESVWSIIFYAKLYS